MDICSSDSDVNCGTVWEVASQWLHFEQGEPWQMRV